MNQGVSRSTAAHCGGLHVSIVNAALTGQVVQLFSECSHNDVVLHNVCHLVLHVLLVEGDQDIGAGIPNLNGRLIVTAVYRFYAYPLSLNIAGPRSGASLSRTRRELSEGGGANDTL